MNKDSQEVRLAEIVGNLWTPTVALLELIEAESIKPRTPKGQALHEQYCRQAIPVSEEQFWAVVNDELQVRSLERALSLPQVVSQ